MLSPLSEITNLEIASQVKLVKDSNSNRVYDFVRHETIPAILNDNLLKFCETSKIFNRKETF